MYTRQQLLSLLDIKSSHGAINTIKSAVVFQPDPWRMFLWVMGDVEKGEPYVTARDILYGDPKNLPLYILDEGLGQLIQWRLDFNMPVYDKTQYLILRKRLNQALIQKQKTSDWIALSYLYSCIPIDGGFSYDAFLKDVYYFMKNESNDNLKTVFELLFLDKVDTEYPLNILSIWRHNL